MFAEFCIYTIAGDEKLRHVALSHKPFVNQESRIWATGLRLLEQARALGRDMPILFADAGDCSRLLYWGLLRELRLLDGQTEYVVDHLRPLPGKHAPQELVLRSSGEPIALGYIRPYAICLTPTFLEPSLEGPILYPDEGPHEGALVDGASMRVTVNAYERNAEARRLCIAHYGCRCLACGFDFEATYGAIGAGFIHVHHIVPLSDVSAEHIVDPVRDLRPVCPNCHAMIHTTCPPLRVEDIKHQLHARNTAEHCTRGRGIRDVH